MVAHTLVSGTLEGEGGRITWAPEDEFAVSRDCAIALQTEQQERKRHLKKKST